MNKIKIIMVVFLLTGLLAFPLMATSQETETGKQAQTIGMGKRKGQNRNSAASNLTTEQRDQISKLYGKFREGNANTLKQLMTNQFDLNTMPKFVAGKALKDAVA
jgi:Spy/CpxP family protein refolding chaperone